MTSGNDDPTIDDPVFSTLLAECLEAIERGEPIDAEKLRQDHPHYADKILQFLNDRDELDDLRAATPPGLGSDPHAATVGMSSPWTTPKSRPRVRYFGDFLLLEELARGGMGVVYKARQERLGRTVAVKMILAGRLANDLDVQRFEREARAAANLTHPNIVSVHEVGEHDGQHFFSMDYIDGESLSATIREQPLSSRRAAEILNIVAGAVHYSHQQGTLHRDLKPGNVLLDRQGQPHVTDFGLAKVTTLHGDDSELTTTGQVLGTPSYMSPEQADGKHDIVSRASDIYSLGAVLYASLTGRPPFASDTIADTLHQVIHKEPVSPRLLNPLVPKDLETVCLKCLQKRPYERYGTAEELADDLGRFLQGRPVVARPVSVVAKGIRWCRRNKPVAGLLASIALILFVSGYLFRSMTSRVDRIDALLEPYEAELENQAQEYEQQRVEDQTLELTDVLQQEPFGFNSRLLLLPDAQQLVLALKNATLQIVDVTSGQTSKILRGFDGPAICLSLGADGSSLYLGTELGSIYHCDLQTETVLQVYETGGWSVDSLDASSDGRFLAWATNSRGGKDRNLPKLPESANVLDTATGEKLFGISGGRSDYQALSFNQTGDELAIIATGEVVITNTQTGQIKRRLRLPGYQSGPLSVAFSPTRPLVAIGYAPYDLALWDLNSDEQARVLKAHDNWVVSLSFTADGEYLASSAGDGTASVWHVETGKEVGRKRFPSTHYINTVSTAGPFLAMGRSGEFVVSRLPKIAWE